jgi:hypothetical protein
MVKKIITRVKNKFQEPVIKKCIDNHCCPVKKYNRVSYC